MALACLCQVATAAVGDLTYDDCFADTGAAGCSVPDDPALAGAFAVAASADGRSVYVASQTEDSISHFTRAADGSLSFQGCFAETTAQGCSMPSDPALDGAAGVAVTPDGSSVYVAAGSDNAVSHFSRAADGSLTYQSCRANTNVDGCGGLDEASLGDPSGIAISPDNENVYVTSETTNSITYWDRDLDGDLFTTRCFEDAPVFADCPEPDDPALAGAADVAISPDGTSVYVTGSADESVSHFSRAGDGDLTYENCLANSNAEGCSVPGNQALGGASGVAVSPDGTSAYVTGAADESLMHFSRAANGNLSYQDCFADSNATDGCPVPSDPALNGAVDVAVSPDNRSVYVASSSDDAISNFDRAADGALIYRSCFRDLPLASCSIPTDAALAGARAVAVSPDGGSLYVASRIDSSISRFRRALSDAAPTPPARCAGAVATAVGTPGRDVIRGTARRDVIAALGGNDLVRSLRGNDLVCGGGGGDVLRGGGGADVLRGGGGRDRLFGGPGRDLLRGGPGRDRQRQ